MQQTTSDSSTPNNQDQNQSTRQNNRSPYFRNLPIHEFEKIVAQIGCLLAVAFSGELEAIISSSRNTSTSAQPKEAIFSQEINDNLTALILGLIAAKNDTEILECGAKIYFYTEIKKDYRLIATKNNRLILKNSSIIATDLVGFDIADKIEKLLQKNGYTTEKAQEISTQLRNSLYNVEDLDQAFNQHMGQGDAVQNKERCMQKFTNLQDAYQKLTWDVSYMQQFLHVRATTQNQTQLAYFSHLPQEEFDTLVDNTVSALSSFLCTQCIQYIGLRTNNEFAGLNQKTIQDNLYTLIRSSVKKNSTAKILECGVKLSIVQLKEPVLTLHIIKNLIEDRVGGDITQHMVTLFKQIGSNNKETAPIREFTLAFIRLINEIQLCYFPSYELKDAENLLLQLLKRHKNNLPFTADLKTALLGLRMDEVYSAAAEVTTTATTSYTHATLTTTALTTTSITTTTLTTANAAAITTKQTISSASISKADAKFEQTVAKTALMMYFTLINFKHNDANVSDKIKKELQEFILPLIAEKSNPEILECGTRVYHYMCAVRCTPHALKCEDIASISIRASIVAKYLVGFDIGEKIEELLTRNGYTPTDATILRKEICGYPQDTLVGANTAKFDYSDSLGREVLLVGITNIYDYELKAGPSLVQEFIELKAAIYAKQPPSSAHTVTTTTAMTTTTTILTAAITTANIYVSTEARPPQKSWTQMTVDYLTGCTII